jgi:hypothetical protein
LPNPATPATAPPCCTASRRHIDSADPRDRLANSLLRRAARQQQPGARVKPSVHPPGHRRNRSTPLAFPQRNLFRRGGESFTKPAPDAAVGRRYQGSRGWHASWIRGNRDAPGGLPSLSPRHGLPMTRIIAAPGGCLRQARECRHGRKESRPRGRRGRTPQPQGRRGRTPHGQGRRGRTPHGAPPRWRGPGAGRPMMQLQGMESTRTRLEAERSRRCGAIPGRDAGGAGRANGRPPEFLRRWFGDSRGLERMHATPAKGRRAAAEAGVRCDGGVERLE